MANAEETIADAVLAAELLRARKEIDPKRIFILGHSLGGTLAPRMASEDPSLAGIIILAGATRPLLDVAREQLIYLSSLTSEAPNPEARGALKGRNDVTIKSYPTLNHLFMSGEGKATPPEYQRAGKVEDFVLDDIAEWIGKL